MLKRGSLSSTSCNFEDLSFNNVEEVVRALISIMGRLVDFFFSGVVALEIKSWIVFKKDSFSLSQM